MMGNTIGNGSGAEIAARAGTDGARSPSSARIHLSWAEVGRMALEVAHRHTSCQHTGVYGIPRGGIAPAVHVAQALRIPLVDEIGPDVLVVDDLVDTGATAERHEEAIRAAMACFDALARKPHSPADYAELARTFDGWVVWPWERGVESVDAIGPGDAVVRLLEWIGDDPTRDGLRDTPRRVVESLAEMTAGYRTDVAALLAVTFADECDEMVVSRGIEFTSLCEHHLLPFIGTATVAYIPAGGRVVGLSKLARVVDAFAHRLQVQERMTRQIAGAIVEHLDPTGVGVIVSARHLCQGCRGVRKPGAEMVTSSMLGAFREDARARAEFLALASG